MLKKQMIWLGRASLRTGCGSLASKVKTAKIQATFKLALLANWEIQIALHNTQTLVGFPDPSSQNQAIICGQWTH